MCTTEVKILNTSTDMDYDICVACIFIADDTINFHDLRRHIHAGLELLPSQFNIAQLGSDEFL
jgi:hypothetical protein